jgi:hypothetical protein
MLASVPTPVLAEGQVKLSASVNKDVAHVAEPIRLVLEVEAPRGTQIELPQLAGQLGNFEVRGSERTKDIPAAHGAESRRWLLEATLETIKSGELTIPPLDVHYTTDSEATTFKTLRSKPIPVRITSVLENRANPMKFRDIKDAVDVAVPELHSYAWLGWTVAGVGAATVLALLTLIVVKRRRAPSPAEWALAMIAELEQLTIMNAADAEAAHNEVVDVVREFFELEFNLPTLSRTTREFLSQAAKVVGLGQTARDRLASLASIADDIKYARLGVGEQQAREALEQAKAFIDECEAHRRATEEETA